MRYNQVHKTSFSFRYIHKYQNYLLHLCIDVDIVDITIEPFCDDGDLIDYSYTFHINRMYKIKGKHITYENLYLLYNNIIEHLSSDQNFLRTLQTRCIDTVSIVQ